MATTPLRRKNPSACMTTKLPTDTLARSIVAALTPLADPARATPMRAYVREQFDYLGIATPVRRKATSALLRTRRDPDDIIKTAKALWTLHEREFQYSAIDLLARQWKVLELRHVDDLLALAQLRSWWDTVDGLAGVVGDVVRTASATDSQAQHTMDLALHHDNLWVRRIAMLHQLGWCDATDTKRLFRYARELAPEPDFFIRKAIGWALRDYAWHAPDTVRSFLDRYGKELSPLSVREAAKHL